MGRIFLEFPLFFLTLITNKEDLEKITRWCIVDNALRRNDLPIQRFKQLKQEKLPKDFKSNPWYKSILMSANELKINYQSFIEVMDIYFELDQALELYQNKYGKDAICRIGRDLIFETIEGKSALDLFKVLCAIQSILGKDIYMKRITKEFIRYRMHGYKSKKIMMKENPDLVLMTDKMLTYRIDKLHRKNFISKLTLKRRLSYYSTWLTDDQLIDHVVWYQSLKKTREKEISSINKTVDKLYDKKLKELKNNQNVLQNQ